METAAAGAAAAVPRDGVLVEFMASGPRYQARVVFPDGRTGTRDLGPAAPIDRAAVRLRDALASRDAGYLRHAQALHRLAFRPLLPLLGEVRRVFLAPGGALGLVPFWALHDGHRFLVEDFDFVYLASGRELLPRAEEVPLARSVVVLADPRFGTARSAADRPWVRLPGTRQEANFLKSLFPRAQLFLGSDATKERLLHLPAPGILHIATHGFFLDDVAAPAGTRVWVEDTGLLAAKSSTRGPLNPSLRSGLVLADSALVTARELEDLDLRGTELVVLSVCNSGRGELGRALAGAGAETVVMSLWPVNDETTAALMERFYRNLRAGNSRARALRQAMLALRQDRPHPHFWAPFVVSGKDGPLRTLAQAP